jgi:hypothetical protein
MKKTIGLIAAALALCAVIVTVADYQPVTGAYSSTVTAAKTFSGTVTTSGAVVETPTALTVTNGQAITVAAGTYLLSGGGGANDTTNTVTVANGTAGQKVTFIAAAATTNLIQFADSGNLALSGAALLDANDVLVLQAPTASAWVEVAQTDN